MKYIEFDIWNNVSKLINDDLIINQIFLGSELLLYEDNVGTYWTNTWGDYPGAPYVVDSKEFDDNFDAIFGVVGDKENYLINVNGTVIEIIPNDYVYMPMTHITSAWMYSDAVFTQQVSEISNNWLISQFSITNINEG